MRRQSHMYALKVTNCVTCIIACIFLSASACPQKPARQPKLEIAGDASWYHSTKEETEFLLHTIQRDGSGQIDWPPDNFSRIVDISIDVTGSVYERKVQFKGETISQAEYNVRKFYDFAVINNMIHPGDHIVTRLFGALPSGKNIKVDEYHNFNYPRLRINFKSTIFTRRFKDVRMEVKSIATPPSSEIYEELLEWSLQAVRAAARPGDGYMKSPLLNHMYSVVAQYPRERQRCFVFVTDGQFDIGRFYFSPQNYAKGKVNIGDMKKAVVQMNIRPFEISDPKVEVILFGFDYGDDDEFRQRQQEMLKWFLEPLKPDQVMFKGY